jgi:hypothetical protein
MDRADRLEVTLEQVEAAIKRRGSRMAVATGGGYTITNPGMRRKKVQFNGLNERDRQLVDLHRRLTGELADITCQLLEASAVELRLAEQVEQAA